MKNSVRISPILLCVMLGGLWAVPASAQDENEHASHHPAGAGNAPVAPMTSSTDAMAIPTSKPSSGMAGMMDQMMTGMGGGEGEQEHHGRRDPFYSRLLAYPGLDPASRRQLAKDAGNRVHQGLMMIGDASADGGHASTPEQQLEVSQRLAEGTALLRSGAAAQSAINGNGTPTDLATSWFQDQMSISSPEAGGMGIWHGYSLPHLLLMAFLGLVSLSLIGLQLLRWRRVRALVTGRSRSATKIAGPAKAVAIPQTAPNPMPEATTLAPSEGAIAAGAALRKSKGWSGQLRVVQICRETPTVLTFRLADPSAGRLPFDFLPGQFLQVEVEPAAGQPARRSYTIASSPTQRAYVEITVKREEQGAVSRFLHDRAKAGDMVKVRAPFGAFTFTGTDSDSVVLIAGGVGITPMMSILRYLTDTAWPGDIFFLYGARSTEEFVFREEIERLERRFANLHVVGAMQRAPGTVWLGAEGPITRDMLATAVPEIARRRIHLCGPPPMMAAIRQQLADLGVPDAQLHTEAFGPASLPLEPVEQSETAGATEAVVAPEPVVRGTDVAATTVTFSISGASAALHANETVLEAAEGAGVEIPYSCRAGTCGVCVTRLLDGEVTMAVESGLAPDDKEAGYILACQAKSTGAPLVVEA